MAPFIYADLSIFDQISESSKQEKQTFTFNDNLAAQELEEAILP